MKGDAWLDSLGKAGSVIVFIAALVIVVVWIIFPFLILRRLEKLQKTLDDIRQQGAGDERANGASAEAPRPQRTPHELYGRKA